MIELEKKDRRILESMLIVLVVGMSYLFYQMGDYKLVVLNLFYLPIVLSGYFLGRTNAGVLALLSVLTITIVATTAQTGVAAFNTPVMLGLALTVWAASLGLSAVLVGTLCDERARTVRELHAAYIGVVEVMSKYLQSATPDAKARSNRIAELCQSVAEEMKRPRKEIDDIRVGALLFDLGNMEITTHLLTKAVDTLEANPSMTKSHTFSGMELVHSLGTVLSGAVPLLLSQNDLARERLFAEGCDEGNVVPVGARIIQVVRAYVARESDQPLDDPTGRNADAILRDLRTDVHEPLDPEVLDVLERLIHRSEAERPASQPAYA